MTKWFLEIQRVWFDTLFLGILTVTLFLIPQPESLDWVLLRRKAIQVSAGFLSAHIMCKLAFPKVDWKTEGQDKLKTLRIAIYVISIYAWAEGG